ncbi:MAG: PDZ domain-containing protein [Planctomycetota bacterium]
MLKFVLAAVVLALAGGDDRLGAGLVPLTADLREFLGLPGDALGGVVQEVRKGSAAEAAGLRAGDIVLRVGKVSLEGVTDEAALKEALARAFEKPGEIELKWMREGKRATGKAAIAPPGEQSFGEAKAGAYRVRGDLPPERLRAAAEALERGRESFERDCGFPLATKGILAAAAFSDPDALARSVAETRSLAAVAPAPEIYLSSRRVLGVVATPEFQPGQDSRVQLLLEAWPGAPLPAWLLWGLARRGGIAGGKAAPEDLDAAANALEVADIRGIGGILDSDGRPFERRSDVWRPLACAFVSFLADRAKAKAGDELPRLLSALREGTPWPKAQPAIFSEAGRAALSAAFADWLLSCVKRTEASAAAIRRALGVPSPAAPVPPPNEPPGKEEERTFRQGFGRTPGLPAPSNRLRA